MVPFVYAKALLPCMNITEDTFSFRCVCVNVCVHVCVCMCLCCVLQIANISTSSNLNVVFHVVLCQYVFILSEFIYNIAYLAYYVVTFYLYLIREGIEPP